MANSKDEFDLAIHLIGAQAVPNFRGIREIKAKEHLLVTSAQTVGVCDELMEDLQDSGVALRKLLLNDPMNMFATIKQLEPELVKIVPASPGALKKIAFNVTGGTKPMAFAAIELANRPDVDDLRIYFDTQNAQKYFWNKNSTDLEPENLPNVTLDNLIHTNFDPVETSVDTINRIRVRAHITRRLWDYHKALADANGVSGKSIQSSAADLIASKRVDGDFDWIATWDDKWNGSRTLAISRKNGLQQIRFGTDAPVTFRQDDFLEYLAGRWFEEWVYLSLQSLKGILLEIRPNVRFKSKDSSDMDANEFDILATDGNRLYVIECKSGQVTGDHIDKLGALASKYGGTYALGVLVARRYQNANNDYARMNFEKVKASAHVCMFHGDLIARALQNYLPEAEPKQIYK